MYINWIFKLGWCDCNEIQKHIYEVESTTRIEHPLAAFSASSYRMHFQEETSSSPIASSAALSPRIGPWTRGLFGDFLPGQPKSRSRFTTFLSDTTTSQVQIWSCKRWTSDPKFCFDWYPYEYVFDHHSVLRVCIRPRPWGAACRQKCDRLWCPTALRHLPLGDGGGCACCEGVWGW